MQRDEDQDGGEDEYVELDSTTFAYLQRYFLHLRRRFISGNGDEDSGDDSDDDFMDEEPITANLEDHALHLDTLSRTGSSPFSTKPNESVFSMIRKRELGPTLRTPGAIQSCPFGPKAKSHIGQRFVPTTPGLVARHNDQVFCGMFSRDGSMYMSACQDRSIRTYETYKWQVQKTIVARDVGWSIISVDYSPDKDWLIYSSWSDYVHICNTQGEHEVHEALDFKPQAHRFCLFSIQFSPDNSEILGGSNDKCLYMYDIVKKQRVLAVRGHMDDINAVCYADKSSQIFFSGSDDALVKVWDTRAMGSGTCAGVLAGHNEGVTFIDSKGDGRYLISNGKDQKIKLWDLRKMKAQQEIPVRPRRQRMWGQPQQPHPEQPDESVMSYRGHKVFQTLIRCRFSPAHSTGQRYIYTGSFDGSVYIYDVLTGKLVNKLNGHQHTVRDVHWHPYDPLIVSTSWDGSVKKWSYYPAELGIKVEEPPPERRSARSLYFDDYE